MISPANAKISLPFLKRKTRKPQTAISDRAGSRREFEIVYRNCHRRIFNLCFRATRDRGIAEKITAETFARLYKEFERWDDKVEIAFRLRNLAVGGLLEYLQEHARLRI